MAEVTQSAKVAVFAIALVSIAGGMYAYVGKARMGAKGIQVSANFRDVTGLAPYGRVMIAGIPVGTVKKISLAPDGRARVDIQIDKGVDIHEDASVAKQTATLLSEPFLALTPGSQGSPNMPDGGVILRVIEPTSTDQVMKDVGEIANKVNKVADSLANSLGSQEGEKQLKAILHNVEIATEQLALITKENRVSLHTTMKNLEDITTDARPKTKQILENVRKSSEEVDKIIVENRPDIRGITSQAREAAEKANRGASSLESALGHVDSITAKVDRGEGTVGRLLKDDSLIDEVQGAAESVNDIVGPIGRLQTVVGLRNDYNFLSNAIKSYVEIRIQPREDKYYSIELVNDPRGRTTIEQIDTDSTNPNQPAHYREVKTSTVNALRFSMQFARRIGAFTGRFGLKESTGGFGLDLHLADNRFELQQDIFGFGEQLVPRWRISLMYEFVKRIWLIGGVDNVLTPDRRDYFVGLSLRFNDEDLKTILPFAPKSF